MARQHERVSFLTEIMLESASGKREARISELSLGGCFVDSIMNLQAGEEVSLTGKLDSGENLTFKGKVAYVMNGFGFGVKFTEISDEGREVLRKIISRSSQ